MLFLYNSDNEFHWLWWKHLSFPAQHIQLSKHEPCSLTRHVKSDQNIPRLNSDLKRRVLNRGTAVMNVSWYVTAYPGTFTAHYIASLICGQQLKSECFSHASNQWYPDIHEYKAVCMLNLVQRTEIRTKTFKLMQTVLAHVTMSQAWILMWFYHSKEEWMSLMWQEPWMLSN